jgi:hypothetical protein
MVKMTKSVQKKRKAADSFSEEPQEENKKRSRRNFKK